MEYDRETIKMTDIEVPNEYLNSIGILNGEVTPYTPFFKKKMYNAI